MTNLPAGTVLPRVIVFYQNPDGTLSSATPSGAGSVDFTATNNLLTLQNTYLDGVETLLGTGNTNTAAMTAALSARLPSTLGQTTKAGSLSVVMASDAAGQALANPSFHRITDGTNNVAVKAASTAPVATDPALVVAYSPNSVQPRFRALGSLAPTNSITAGGAAQTALAANATRVYLFVQNNSSGDLWMNYTGAAAIGTGIKIVAGAYYENPNHFSPNGAVSIIGATTGQAYTAIEA